MKTYTSFIITVLDENFGYMARHIPLSQLKIDADRNSASVSVSAPTIWQIASFGVVSVSAEARE